MKPSLPGDITHKPKAIKINPEVFAGARELTGSPTSQPLSTASRSKESLILSPRPLNSGRKFQPTGAVFKAHTPKNFQEQLESSVRPSSAKNEGGFHSQKSPVMSPLVRSPSVVTSKLSLSVLPVSSFAGPIKNFVLAPSGDRHGLNLCNIQVPIGKPDSQVLAVEQKNQSALVGFDLGRVQKPLVMAMVASSKTPNNQDSPLMATVSVRSGSLPIPIVSKPFVSFPQTTVSLLPSGTNAKPIIATAPSGLNSRKNISAILLPGGFSTAAPFTILNRDVTVSTTKPVAPTTLPGGVGFAPACRPEAQVAASGANEASLSQILSPFGTRFVLKPSTAPGGLTGTALQPYQIVQAPLQLQMVQSQPAGAAILGIGRSGLKPQTSTQIQYLIPSFPLSQDAIHGKVVPVLQTSSAATASTAIVVDLAGSLTSAAAAAKPGAASGRTNVSAGARPMLKLAIASPSISVQPQASPISAFPFFAGSQLVMLNQPQLSTVVTLAGGQQFQLAGLSQLAHVAMATGHQQQQQHAIHHQK